MKLECLGKLVTAEEVPGGLIDHFVRRVAEDVDYGVGGVEDARIVFEVCPVKSAGKSEDQPQSANGLTVNGNEGNIHLDRLFFLARVDSSQ